MTTSALLPSDATQTLNIPGRQERLRVSERTIAGLMRVRAEGRVLGRPKVVQSPNRVIQLRREGKTLTAIAAELQISESSVYRALRNLPTCTAPSETSSIRC